MQKIIDSHMHLIDIEKFHIFWCELSPYSSLNKNFALNDYYEAIGDLPVEKCIYVEVHVKASQVTEENDKILKLCEKVDNPLSGMIIYGDMSEPDFEKYFDPYKNNPFVKGVRKALIFDTPKSYCLQPQFIKNVQLLGKHDKVFELCMKPEELLDGAALIEKCPNTIFILEHVGFIPYESTKELHSKWASGIEKISKYRNVVCKISGMIESASNNSWKPVDLQKNFEICVDAFGEDRLLFGSNWPVCTLTGTYKRWVDALNWLVKDKTSSFQKKFFYDNAERVYKLT